MKLARSFAISTVLSAAMVLAHAPRVAWAQTGGAPAPAAEPTPQAVAAATTAFKKGTLLFQQKKFPLALAEFQKSYDTVSSPNSLLYVARCQAETGVVKDAYRTFGRVIREAEERMPTEPKYTPTRDSAVAEQKEIAKKVALLTVTVTNADDDSRLKVGEGALPRDEWGRPVPMDPGTVQVVVEHPTRAPISRSVELAIGRSESVTIDAMPAEAPPPIAVAPPPDEDTGGGMSPLVPIGIGAAGVGVVGFVIFAVAGSSANSTYDELQTLCGGESACPSSVSASQVTDLQDSGRSSQTLANVGLIVGAVGVAAGATLLVIGLTSDDGEEQVGARPAPSTSIAVGPSWTGVRGTF